MATHTVQDYRRTDLRTNIFDNPYWISSGIIDAAADGVTVKDKGCVVFSFPATKTLFVERVVVEVIKAFTAGTTAHLGLGTLATDAVTTGGNVTVVADDEYILHEDITMTTKGLYGATTANTSAWLTSSLTGTFASPNIIVGVAATVPCIYLIATNAGNITAGKCRVHMRIDIIPGLNA